MNNSIHIIEGTIQYVPRISGYDKYERHSLTVCPDDQTLFDGLKKAAADLMKQTYKDNGLSGDIKPMPFPWKQFVSTDKQLLSFAWTDKALDAKQVYVFDEHDQPYDNNYLDKQLRYGKVKLSFKLKPYCFVNYDGENVVGIKLHARKIQILGLPDLSDVENNTADEPELVTSDF